VTHVNVEECYCTVVVYNAINKGGQSLPAQAAESPQETSPPSSSVQQPPFASISFIILTMALDSVPTYLSNLGSAHRAARTQQQRIRYAEVQLPQFAPALKFARISVSSRLFFIFCSVKKPPGKMSAPGPQTLMRRMTMATSGGSTVRRSSPIPTSQGS
jgi:hypothetical protein